MAEEPRSSAAGRQPSAAQRRMPIVGWREWVMLPELCDSPIKAKVDTGARTSALHAFDLEVTSGGPGISIAIFDIHPVQRSANGAERVKLPVVGVKNVRSSNGIRETRPVVRTTVQLGEYRWAVDFTLARRDEMGFRMLLGRAAVRRRFLVDSGRSYQQGARS